MAKEKQSKKEPTLSLDGVEYKIEDLDNGHKVKLAHLQDINRKMETTKFNLQQLQYGYNAIVTALKGDLENMDSKVES
tara:strand:- start:273 stop:506 length:234 start_codon:yes stop_codon:yes gene_type:complete